MKDCMMRLSISLTLLLFFCWNGTLVDSNGKSKLPDVNFYGTIEDHTRTFDAEYIIIDRRYEDIPVYPYQSIKKLKKRITAESTKEHESNKKDEIDPTQNKAFLKLDEIKSIELQHPEHPTSSTIEINQKTYIEIIVTSINGSKNNYLIESSRKVTCKEVDKGPHGAKQGVLIDRELNMIHIKKLIIKGYKSANDADEKKAIKAHCETPNIVEQKKEISSNTENLLDQIEENVKNLSQSNPSAFEKMKSNIISLLKSLRQQLQKMLDMLQ